MTVEALYQSIGAAAVVIALALAVISAALVKLVTASIELRKEEIHCARQRHYDQLETQRAALEQQHLLQILEVCAPLALEVIRWLRQDAKEDDDIFSNVIDRVPPDLVSLLIERLVGIFSKPAPPPE